MYSSRKEARFVEELGGLQAGEATVERHLGPFSYGLESKGNIFTNDGGGLEQAFLLQWQAVDAGGQHRLHRGGT